MNPTIVITGAGSGIGRAIAQTLAQKNYKLILLGRNASNLEETRALLHLPDQHSCFSCDIRKPIEIREALKASGAESIHALVANAGTGGENHYGTGDRWEEVIETNLNGTYYSVRECLPYLKKEGDGYRKIVIISSILARLGVPGYSAYCASKAGLLGLTRSLASELTSDKILVNALLPGWVDTAMAHEGIQGFADALGVSKEEAYKQAMSQVPLGKMSQPEEVAALTAFLISADGDSFTGQTIDINNGALMP